TEAIEQSDIKSENEEQVNEAENKDNNANNEPISSDNSESISNPEKAVSNIEAPKETKKEENGLQTKNYEDDSVIVTDQSFSSTNTGTIEQSLIKPENDEQSDSNVSEDAETVGKGLKIMKEGDKIIESEIKTENTENQGNTDESKIMSNPVEQSEVNTFEKKYSNDNSESISNPVETVKMSENCTTGLEVDSNKDIEAVSADLGSNLENPESMINMDKVPSDCDTSGKLETENTSQKEDEPEIMESRTTNSESITKIEHSPDKNIPKADINKIEIDSIQDNIEVSADLRINPDPETNPENPESKENVDHVILESDVIGKAETENTSLKSVEAEVTESKASDSESITNLENSSDTNVTNDNTITGSLQEVKKDEIDNVPEIKEVRDKQS
uniref:Uncharacterized protein n=1 Tax=Megaselia scalaris TaxID=36166 RepID=T1H1J6_MEGSC